MKHFTSLFILQTIVLLSIFYLPLSAQNTPSSFTVFLIGDAGADTSSGPALLLLQKKVMEDTNSAVIFLGDNVYPQGLSLKNNKKSSISRKKMESQLRIFEKYSGQVYVIPGNHDWKKGKIGGLKQVENEAVFVDEYLLRKTTVNNREKGGFYPKNGLPGPYSMLAAPGIRLIIVDTDWWLHRQLFHRVGKTGTKKATEARFFHQLDSLLSHAKDNNERVIIAAHHPLFSNGNHGHSKHFMRFMNNYTPFLLFGELGMNRLFYQDIEQPRYKKMKKKLLAIMNKYPGLIYASGHDHNLQLLKTDNLTHIVSGSGSKHKPFKTTSNNLTFGNDTEKGFFLLRFNENSTLHIEAWGATQGLLWSETLHLSK